MNNFIKSKYFSLAILAFILLLGAFLRFYRIREYMVFLGDEGRDMLIVKRMIVDHKLTLLGPITSVGSMYMGPIYYYFMAPFLWLWRLDPVGPSIMVVFFSLATIALLYKIGCEFFYSSVGFIASFLYAISSLTVKYGRSSWNPNIVPFFALLLVYSLLKVVVKRRFNYLFLTGLCLGVLIQLHYVSYLFFPVIFFCLLLIRFSVSFKKYLLGLLGFVISYSPFLMFELRHQFVNTKAVLRFIRQQKEANPFGLVNIWNSISDVVVRLFWRLVVVESATYTKIFILGIVIFTLSWFFKERKKEKALAFKIVLVWLFVGVLSFAIYRGVTYDYYFGSLFPVPFLFTGIMFSYLWTVDKIGKLVTCVILTFLIFFNFKNSPLAIEPNNLLKNTGEISRFVYDRTEGKPYNFALIADRNSDHAYRYFLEIWKHPPVTIENPTVDPERKTVQDQLLVVCEEKVCQPEGHPRWEIAGFGRAEIVGEWKVSTARVFKLVHYE